MRIKTRLQIHTAITVLTFFSICLILFLALYYVKKVIDASGLVNNMINNEFERSYAQKRLSAQ